MIEYDFIHGKQMLLGTIVELAHNVHASYFIKSDTRKEGIAILITSQ